MHDLEAACLDADVMHFPQQLPDQFFFVIGNSGYKGLHRKLIVPIVLTKAHCRDPTYAHRVAFNAPFSKQLE
jgi:hypothetical protein